MSVFNLKTGADVRDLFYNIMPLLATLLVGYGVLNNSEAQLYMGLGAAVLGPVVSAVMARTLSTFRTAFYAVVAAVQAIVVYYGIATDGDFAMWMPLIVALVGGTAGRVASAHTFTSAPPES